MFKNLVMLAADTWARNSDGSIVMWNGVPQHRYVNGPELDLAWVGYVWLAIIGLVSLLFFMKAAAAMSAGNKDEAKSAFVTALLVLVCGLMLPMIIVLIGGLFHAGHTGKGDSRD